MSLRKSMATVVCNNTNCKYKSANNFCGKDFVMLNGLGACLCWWQPDGNFRGGQMWDYAEAPSEDLQPKPDDAIEQGSPHDQK